MPYKTKNRSEWHQAAFQITNFKCYFTRLYFKVKGIIANVVVNGLLL